MPIPVRIDPSMLQLESVYSSPGGIALRYDFLQPKTSGPHPLLVFIHGGGWISGDRSDFRDVAEMFVEKGYAAALIQYRLAPLHPFPAAVEDVQAFVRYARANATELGIIPDRIASFGSSAGGHLALMLGVTDAPVDGVSSRANVVIDYCGLTDITHYKDHHFDISWSFVEQFMPEPFEGHEDLYKQASPLAHVDKLSVPTLIVHGEVDDIVPIAQSEALDDALSAQKVPHKFIRVPGEGHGFSMAVWPELERETLAFLGAHL